MTESKQVLHISEHDQCTNDRDRNKDKWTGLKYWWMAQVTIINLCTDECDFKYRWMWHKQWWLPSIDECWPETDQKFLENRKLKWQFKS